MGTCNRYNPILKSELGGTYFMYIVYGHPATALVKESSCPILVKNVLINACFSAAGPEHDY